MNHFKVVAVPGAGRLGVRAASASLFLAAVAVAAGCTAPPAQETLAEPGTELTATDFAFIEGSEPAGTPAGPLPEKTSTFFSAAEAPAQLLAARERFPEQLPDGIPWATDPYAREPEKDAVIEAGVFDGLVAGYWLCAWMDDYLQAQDDGDRQRGESAVKELEKYTTLPSTVASHQNPEDFAAHVIDPAKAGNATTLREFFGNSCTGYQRAVDSFSADR